ncbi:MAG TPA: flagellar motor switch protein FliN [Pirellulales bacterium]|nr:flagellar motor switch protein FliN [Pirellulales bacterium]
MTDQPPPVNNDEIERLLQQAGEAVSGVPAAAGGSHETPATGRPTEAATAAPPRRPEAAAPRDEAIASADIELLLKQAQDAIASIDKPHESLAASAKSFQLEELSGAAPNTERATLELIRDVELDVRIEFGRTQLYLEDVLKLRKGSVVALDKLAGDPVDVFVNGRLIAKGEVLVLNDNFCVRVAELIAGEQPG